MAYHPFRHLGLKVLAVALATLLWLTVAGEQIVERSLRIPLEFRNIPVAIEIVGEPPSTVDVRMRGSSAVLSRLEPGEIVAVLDLASARPGSRLFHLRTEEIRSPYGVEITHIQPGTVALTLEKAARRVVPVVPAVEGEPAPGYVVGQVSAEPANVEIVGPESRVRELGEATTEPVSVDGARGRVRDVVNVGVGDTAVRLVEPLSAAVEVDISPAPVERPIEGVLIRWRNLAPGLRAKIAETTARVTIRGRREAVAGVGAPSLEAFVDLAGLGPGRYNLQVRIEPPQDFGIVSVDPELVDVTIR